MINRVTLVGRLTKDPELRYTPTGHAVARFTLAVNRITKKDNQQQADFINIVVWRKLAENVANYLHKGSQAAVDGRIQTGSYDGQDGKKVYTTEVVAEGVQFLDAKSQHGNENNQNSYGNQQNSHSNQQNGYSNQQNSYSNQQNGYSNQQSVTPYTNNVPNNISDDDLPF